MQPSIVLIILAGVIGYVLIWCLVCLLISRLGGWSKLAREFRTERMPEGEFFPRQHVFINGSRYKGLMTIGITDAGLYLQVHPIFRVGHPPLLVDWSAIGPFEKRSLGWMTGSTATIEVAGSNPVSLQIRDQHVADAIEAHRRRRSIV